jgi:hypothetical protein
MKTARVDPDHLLEQGAGISPEFRWVRRVCAAVLTSALIDAARYHARAKKQARFNVADGAEAWNYMTRTDVDWPLSFPNLCLMFEIDPDRLRRRIKCAPHQILGGRHAARADKWLPKDAGDAG